MAIGCRLPTDRSDLALLSIGNKWANSETKWEGLQQCAEQIIDEKSSVTVQRPTTAHRKNDRKYCHVSAEMHIRDRCLELQMKRRNHYFSRWMMECRNNKWTPKSCIQEIAIDVHTQTQNAAAQKWWASKGKKQRTCNRKETNTKIYSDIWMHNLN